MVTEVIDRQLAAYNAHDADAFAAHYADDVVVDDADGNVTIEGRADLRAAYAALFASSPEVHVKIVKRIVIGAHVIDEELLTGREGGDVRAVVVYRVGADGLIDRVRLIR